MEKRIIALSLFLVFAFQQAKACDACGCSVSGGGIGLMSAYRYNFVGLQWYHAGFETIPGHGVGAKDKFYTLELAIRYHFSDRFKILLNQPFKLNVREVGDARRNLHGLSDTRIFANYTLLSSAKIGKKSKLYWEAGAGIKVPIGKFDVRIHDKDLPDNFNIGNGSWGYLFQSSMIWTRKKSGMIWTNNYQYNRPTKEGYTFGNQLSTQLLFFHQIEIKETLKIIPNLGWYSEWVAEDKYAIGKSVTGTGGNGMYFSAGFHVKKQNWILGASWSLPVVQSYSHDEVKATTRFSTQISYTF